MLEVTVTQSTIVSRHDEILDQVDGDFDPDPPGRVHEAVAAGAEEEARLRTEATTQELKAEGNPDSETVPRHLQDPDQTVQGTKKPGKQGPPQ